MILKFKTQNIPLFVFYYNMFSFFLQKKDMHTSMYYKLGLLESSSDNLNCLKICDKI